MVTIWVIVVHPRSRGKHRRPARALPDRVGSPPLAREAQTSRTYVAPHHRFTPARAGSTPPRSSPRPRTSVHPRSRGKHSRARQPPWRRCGSPPLAREAHDPMHKVAVEIRFTPARAGSTTASERQRNDGPVHPRSRGKHSCVVRSRERTSGSPPLAREALRLPSPLRLDRRFTPARAGSTASAVS